MLHVNFALERTTVVYDPAKTNAEEFEKKVEDLGYHVVQQKTKFDISGMTCAACATKIEKRLSKMDGVSRANVNFALETIAVSFDNYTVRGYGGGRVKMRSDYYG
ncbi:cation transporter [Lentibacillus sp.]|uniref:cation transporter n=1 Tax=Lentibacillus sp. TaxID=1925746 RepID=UPI0039C8FBAD